MGKLLLISGWEREEDPSYISRGITPTAQLTELNSNTGWEVFWMENADSLTSNLLRKHLGVHEKASQVQGGISGQKERQ